MESNLPFDTNQNNLMPEGEHHPDKILQKRIRKARKERREARQNRIIGIINSTWASIARAEGAQRLVDGRRSLPTE